MREKEMLQQNKQQPPINEADLCLKKLSYFGIINNLNHLILLEPDYSHFYFQLAEAYRKLAKIHHFNNYYSKSLKNYDHAIKLNPHVPQYYFKRAKSHLLKHKRYKALSDFNLAVELDSRNSLYLQQRAQLALELGKSEIALNDYLQLASLNPDNTLFQQKVNELQQPLPHITLKRATKSLLDKKATTINSLAAQRDQLKATTAIAAVVCALSTFIVIAGIVLAAVGAITLGLTLVSFFGAVALLTAAKAIDNYIEERELGKQIKTQKIELHKIRANYNIDYAALTAHPNLDTADASITPWKKAPISIRVSQLQSKLFNYQPSVTATADHTSEAVPVLSPTSPPHT